MLYILENFWIGILQLYLNWSLEIWLFIPEPHLTSKHHGENRSKTKPFHLNEEPNVIGWLEAQGQDHLDRGNNKYI